MVSGRNSGELCSLSSPGLGSWAGAQDCGKSHVVFKLSETKKIIRPVVRMTRHCLGDPRSPGSGNHPPGEPEQIYPLVTSRLQTEGVSRAPPEKEQRDLVGLGPSSLVPGGRLRTPGDWESLVPDPGA